MYKAKIFTLGLVMLLLFVAFTVPPKKCDDVPVLNETIIEFVSSKIGKKVGRGECWDLAAEALYEAKATWDGLYGYGKEVDVKKECVYPGDIIQFEKVVIKYLKDGRPFEEKMPHHTAVVYEVKNKGDFMIAHQNTAYAGKKVAVSSLNVDNIIRGKYRIYRPIK